MTIEAIEIDHAHDAIQYAETGGGHAIRLGGKYLVVTGREADRLAEAGVAFAYLGEHEMPDGRKSPKSAWGNWRRRISRNPCLNKV